MKSLPLIFLTLFLLKLLNVKFTFLKPSQLRAFQNQPIPYLLAPFGKFPYGRELYGQLHFSSSDGCSSFRNKTKKTEFPLMLLLSDKNCNIKLKAYNAEKSGAKLAIIIRSQKTHNELT